MVIGLIHGLILLLITLVYQLCELLNNKSNSDIGKNNESYSDSGETTKSYLGGRKKLANKTPTSKPMQLIPIKNELSDDIKRALEYINNAVKNPKPTLFYEGISYTYTYGYGLRKIFKHNCHYGQRKLLLNEIQFLTYYLNKPNKTDCIVYVGSAPCEHLTIIMQMFPNNKYLLIDPNFCIIDTDKSVYVYQNPDVISSDAVNIINTYEMGANHQKQGVRYLRQMKFLDGSTLDTTQFKEPKIKEHLLKIKRNFEENKTNIFDRIAQSKHSVFIIQDYMTIALSKLIANKNKNILFLSDLRTSIFTPKVGPTDADILFNDCLQIAILDIIQPTYSMLKFHPPYYCSQWEKYLKALIEPQYSFAYESVKYVNELIGKDLLKEALDHKHYNYKSDHILLQPWAPVSSSEARLIIPLSSIKKKDFKYYPSDEWDNKYYVFRFIRMYSVIDLFRHILDQLSQYGYDYCYDCYIELSIIYQYLEFTHGKTKNILKYVPPQSDQTSRISKAINIIELINSHLRYGLSNLPLHSDALKNKSGDKHKFTNKTCTLHGSLVPHKENYFYIEKEKSSKPTGLSEKIIWKDGSTYKMGYNNLMPHENYHQILIPAYSKKVREHIFVRPFNIYLLDDSN